MTPESDTAMAQEEAARRIDQAIEAVFASDVLPYSDRGLWRFPEGHGPVLGTLHGKVNVNNDIAVLSCECYENLGTIDVRKLVTVVLESAMAQEGVRP
jgi:hypothetical protein